MHDQREHRINCYRLMKDRRNCVGAADERLAKRRASRLTKDLRSPMGGRRPWSAAPTVSGTQHP